MTTSAGRWVCHPGASAVAWLADLEPADASAEERELRRRRRELLPQERQAGSEAQRQAVAAAAGELHDEILHRFGARVSEFLPDQFEAYVKVLHPIYVDEGVVDRSVTWDQVDKRQRAPGRTPHDRVDEVIADATLVGGGPEETTSSSRIRWAELAERYGVRVGPELDKETFTDAFGGSWPRYLFLPEEGDLEEALLRVLVDHLANHTGPDEPCVFYYWLLKTDHLDWERVFEGALRSVLHEPANWDVWGSPSAWWPSSRTWCVVTDFDAAFTLVGGPRDLIDALVEDGELETIAVSPHTRLDRYAARRNRDS